MKRLLAIVMATALFGAMLAGCHAEGGVSGNDVSSVLPGR